MAKFIKVEEARGKHGFIAYINLDNVSYICRSGNENEHTDVYFLDTKDAPVRFFFPISHFMHLVNSAE